MKMLSKARPRPSRLMRAPAFSKAPIHSALVNWLPWSVLWISGRRRRESARSSALTQKALSNVLETSQANT